MRIYLFNSLHKLELAKYSLTLSLLALLIAVIFGRVDYKMALQSLRDTYLQNKNAIRRFTFVRDTRIFCCDKETPLAIENETGFDSKTLSRETKMQLSLKTGVLIINPYQDERYFGKMFLKSLFFECYKTAKDLKVKTVSSLKNTSGSIYLTSQESSEPQLESSLCLDDEFLKNKCYGSKRWATWENSELAITYQSNHQFAKPSGHSKVAIFVEKYYMEIKSVPMKTIADTDEFIRKNGYSSISGIMNSDKTSSFECILKPISIQHDSACLKEHTLYPSHCSIIEQASITSNEYNISKNAKLTFEEAQSKQTLSNTQGISNPTKGEIETFKFAMASGPLTTGNKLKSLGTKKPKFDQKFSNRIWSIERNVSNSDLQKLEDVVTYPATASTSFRNFEQSDTRHLWKNSKEYSYDNPLIYAPRKEFYFADYQLPKEKERTPDILKGHCTATKRARANSADSGVCLDYNFETLPESPPKECTLYEDAGSSDCKSDVSKEFLSGLNSSKPLYVEDCYKVCQLCNKIVLDKFFFSCRFGLLLNCFHSFCYTCIRNYGTSKRFSSDTVSCPKCGKPSPGIVSSPRWIRDTSEKTVLFQKYEKESKFFRRQQQVFFLINFRLKDP